MKPLRLALLPTAAALACGPPTAQWPPAPEGYRISVVVDNDLTEPGDVLVRMMPAGGAPTLLGGAAPGEEKTFEYRTPTLGGTFTLTARTGDGRLYSSRAFTLFPDAVVMWRLRRNELRVVRGSDRTVRPPSQDRSHRMPRVP
jgi:hypothetical protein